MNLNLKMQFALLLMFVISSFVLAGAVGNISFSKVLVNGVDCKLCWK
jgi:hypothetical protein